MKISDFKKDLRSKDKTELHTILSENLLEHFKLRVRQFDDQIKNTAILRLTRKKIAIIKTIIKENDKG